MNEIMAFHTGKNVAEVASDTERDHFLTPQQALDYGIVDEINETRTALAAVNATKA